MKTQAHSLLPGAPSGLFSRIADFFRAPGVSDPKPQSGREVRLQLAKDQSQRRLLNRSKLAHVVKETMLKAGVLSSQFQFKTLAMNREGTAYSVLIDLDPSAARISADICSLCEAGMKHGALARHEIEVLAVYWRSAVVAPVLQRMKASAWERDQRPAALSDTDFGDLTP